MVYSKVLITLVLAVGIISCAEANLKGLKCKFVKEGSQVKEDCTNSEIRICSSLTFCADSPHQNQFVFDAEYQASITSSKKVNTYVICDQNKDGNLAWPGYDGEYSYQFEAYQIDKSTPASFAREASAIPLTLYVPSKSKGTFRSDFQSNLQTITHYCLPICPWVSTKQLGDSIGFTKYNSNDHDTTSIKMARGLSWYLVRGNIDTAEDISVKLIHATMMRDILDYHGGKRSQDDYFQGITPYNAMLDKLATFAKSYSGSSGKKPVIDTIDLVQQLQTGVYKTRGNKVPLRVELVFNCAFRITRALLTKDKDAPGQYAFDPCTNKWNLEVNKFPYASGPFESCHATAQSMVKDIRGMLKMLETMNGGKTCEVYKQYILPSIKNIRRQVEKIFQDYGIFYDLDRLASIEGEWKEYENHMNAHTERDIARNRDIAKSNGLTDIVKVTSAVSGKLFDIAPILQPFTAKPRPRAKLYVSDDIDAAVRDNVCKLLSVGQYPVYEALFKYLGFDAAPARHMSKFSLPFLDNFFKDEYRDSEVRFHSVIYPYMTFVLPTKEGRCVQPPSGRSLVHTGEAVTSSHRLHKLRKQHH